MANPSTSRKTTKNRGTTTRRTTAKRPSGGKKTNHTRKKKAQAENSFLGKEVVVLLAFACSILLLLSNFKMCGAFGEFLRGFMLGVFGILGYLVPFLLFFGTCFYLSNRNNPKAMSKLAVLTGVALLLCGMYQMIGGGSFDPSLTLKDYYVLSSHQAEGGLIGGAIVKLLIPNVGYIGSFIILFIIILIGLVYITERSVVEFVGRRGTEVYEYAREDVSRRKEAHLAKQEERRRYRAEQKVTGVALNTGLEGVNPSELSAAEEIPIRQPEPAKEPVRESREYRPVDFFTGEIHLPPSYKEARTIEPERPEADLSYLDGDFLDRAEIESIMLEKERQNVTELDNIIEIDPEPVYFEPEDEIYVPYEPVVPGIAAEPEPPAADFKQIVTASGKIIEVEAELPEAYPLKESGLPSAGQAAAVTKQPPSSPSTAAVKPVAAPKPPVKYQYPPVDLLQKGKVRASGNTDRELKETAIKLQQTLHNFGVGVTVTEISCGPSVTRYELHPEQGVKVSKIVSLADDIKLNLAAADIRIEAPIPGKAAVGIEVPNKENHVVHFRDLLESPEFKKHPSRICFGVGKDIAGQTVVADIGKMPHLLIAGATGSGKSVCINTLIMSVLYKADPAEVKLIMIDPKVVELSVYNGIPHLMIPVVTDPKKAAGALNWAVAEMSTRYKKFAEYNVRDLKGYNERVANIEDIEDENKPEKLPQIIIIVDELADLMMVAPGEVEDAICRLAQLARAAGIHLVIATQRPSVNVITGLIKANVPSRIAFSVSSGVDSRTIIDMNGAEKLLGKGDMLFYPAGYQKPLRVQGAFVSDSEVTKVVEFLTSQGIADSYQTDLESQIVSASSGDSGAGGGKSDRDAYFEQAGRFIIEKDKASIGMLQRNFKIGFNRAARIMDQLAEVGIVGEEEGTKPRKVLMSMEEFQQFVEEAL